MRGGINFVGAGRGSLPGTCPGGVQQQIPGAPWSPTDWAIPVLEGTALPQQRPLIPAGFSDPSMSKSPHGPEGGMEMDSHLGSPLAQPLLLPPANYSLIKPEVKQLPGTTSSPNLITNLNDSQRFPLPDFYDFGDKGIYL